MNHISKPISQQAPHTPLFRQSLGYILLICFLNTIFFPVIHYPTLVKKTNNLTSEPESVGSLTEYILESLLEISDPTPDYQEDDVDTIVEGADDIDLIDHVTFNITFNPFMENIKQYGCIHEIPLYCFNTSTTPPPELFI